MATEPSNHDLAAVSQLHCAKWQECSALTVFHCSDAITFRSGFLSYGCIGSALTPADELITLSSSGALKIIHHTGHKITAPDLKTNVSLSVESQFSITFVQIQWSETISASEIMCITGYSV